jgi:hypothetical protein
MASMCPLFMTKMSKNGKSIISFNFHCEFNGRSNAVEVMKKLLQSFWSMRPNQESAADVSEPFSGFVVSCI